MLTDFCVWCEIGVWFHSSLVEETVLFLACVLGTQGIDWLILCLCIYFWVLYTVPLVYLSFSNICIACLITADWLCNLKSGSTHFKCFQFCSSVSKLIWFCVLSWFHVNCRIFVYLCEKRHWSFGKVWITYVHFFGEYEHFNKNNNSRRWIENREKQEEMVHRIHSRKVLRMERYLHSPNDRKKIYVRAQCGTISGYNR